MASRDGLPDIEADVGPTMEELFGFSGDASSGTEWQGSKCVASSRSCTK